MAIVYYLWFNRCEVYTEYISIAATFKIILTLSMIGHRLYTPNFRPSTIYGKAILESRMVHA